MVNAFTKGSFTDMPQPLRMAVMVILLSVAVASRWAKPFVTRHYEVICMSAIAAGMVFTSIISTFNSGDDNVSDTLLGRLLRGRVRHLRHLWVYQAVGYRTP